MDTMNDWELIREYVKSRSEAAFAELVARHLSWVYSVALRKVGNCQLAEEVAQSVFVLLAVKADTLRSGTILSGWLFRTTCFVGSRALRSEQRQKNREQLAASMNLTITAAEEKETAWEKLEPLLDQVVASLQESDRAAILLRYYERKSLQDVGLSLGISEEAAKKRVTRAVDKIRALFAKRGATVGTAVLGMLLTESVVKAAPLALAAFVIKATTTAGVSVSATLPHLARDTIRAWRLAKVKLAGGLMTAAVVLIWAGMNTSGLLNRSTSTGQLLSNEERVMPSTNLLAQLSAATNIKAEVRPARKRGALTGLVVDDRGRPVLGAKVWGGYCQKPFGSDTTDAFGEFALANVGSPPLVTVIADGFAADQQEFDTAKASGVFVFRLNPILPLKVRLVDESGAGVPNVRWSLSSWWGRWGSLAIHVEQSTDGEGRLDWRSPPRGEVQVEFGKNGYCWSRTNKLTADGQEHTIVLHPDATVKGSVTDAETGVPVARFRYTIGHSQPWFPSDETPMWDFRGKEVTNGYYKFLFDEEQVPYLRIEAEGYQTVETRLHLINGVESIQDFQLKPSNVTNAIRGLVLLPDGSPAAGVEVALCTPQAGVMLSGAGFSSEVFGRDSRYRLSDYRRKTDDKGAFSFEPQPGAHTVAAAGRLGFGQVRCFDWSRPLEIRLQAWGRVNGKLRTRDGQYAGRKVKWVSPGHLTSWMTVFSERFFAESDASGEFTLEHIPPGAGRVAVEYGDQRAIFSQTIQVNPGETVQVQVGGEGRSVSGKLIAPEGVKIRNLRNQVNFAQLHSEWDSYNMPPDLKGNAAEKWKLEFEDTELGRKWFSEQLAYHFKVEEDGSFIIPEVLAGKYRLFINVAQGNLGSGLESKPSSPADPRIASASLKVTVLNVSDENAASMDLGEIILNPF